MLAFLLLSLHRVILQRSHNCQWRKIKPLWPRLGRVLLLHSITYAVGRISLPKQHAAVGLWKDHSPGTSGANSVNNREY